VQEVCAGLPAGIRLKSFRFHCPAQVNRCASEHSAALGRITCRCGDMHLHLACLLRDRTRNHQQQANSSIFSSKGSDLAQQFPPARSRFRITTSALLVDHLRHDQVVFLPLGLHHWRRTLLRISLALDCFTYLRLIRLSESVDVRTRTPDLLRIRNQPLLQGLQPFYPSTSFHSLGESASLVDACIAPENEGF